MVIKIAVVPSSWCLQIRAMENINQYMYNYNCDECCRWKEQRGDLMRKKGNQGGPFEEVTPKGEKEQGESNGEGLHVCIVTCSA